MVIMIGVIAHPISTHSKTIRNNKQIWRKLNVKNNKIMLLHWQANASTAGDAGDIEHHDDHGAFAVPDLPVTLAANQLDQFVFTTWWFLMAVWVVLIDLIAFSDSLIFWYHWTCWNCLIYLIWLKMLCSSQWIQGSRCACSSSIACNVCSFQQNALFSKLSYLS